MLQDSLNKQTLVIKEELPNLAKELPALPTSAIYTLILLGIAIFIFFRLINYLSPLWTKSQRNRSHFQRVISIIQLIFWASYFLIIINHIWKWNILFASGFLLIYLILVLWVCWSYFRDFIAGTIFKYNNRFSINESIKIDDIHGRIIDLRNRYIIIEDDKNGVSFIPYSKLIGNIIVKTHPAENILHYRFILRTENNLNSESLIKNIKRTIFELPWVSIKENPQVTIIESKDDYLKMEVTVFSPDQKYFHKIEESIKKKFEA